MREKRLADQSKERVGHRLFPPLEAPDDLELEPFTYYGADLPEQVFRLLPGDEPAVDKRRCPTRDDIDLLSRSEAGRGHSVVERGGELEGCLPVRQEPVEHEVGQRGVKELRHNEPRAEGLPRSHRPVGGRRGLADVNGEMGGAELGDRLGEPDHRVLPVRDRGVAGVSHSVHLELTDAPLAGLDHVVANAVYIVAEAADLAQHVLGAHQLCVLFHKKA